MLLHTHETLGAFLAKRFICAVELRTARDGARARDGAARAAGAAVVRLGIVPRNLLPGSPRHRATRRRGGAVPAGAGRDAAEGMRGARARRAVHHHDQPRGGEQQARLDEGTSTYASFTNMKGTTRTSSTTARGSSKV